MLQFYQIKENRLQKLFIAIWPIFLALNVKAKKFKINILKKNNVIRMKQP